jgi:hypothetical protein
MLLNITLYGPKTSSRSCSQDNETTSMFHMLRHAYVKEAMGIASKDRCSTDVLQKERYTKVFWEFQETKQKHTKKK